MVRRRKRLRLVIDTMAVVRGARALRQRPPVPDTPELILILSWIEDEHAFDWLFSEEILDEYSEGLLVDRDCYEPRIALAQRAKSCCSSGWQEREGAFEEEKKCCFEVAMSIRKWSGK